jgi:hypothetical protein
VADLDQSRKLRNAGCEKGLAPLTAYLLGLISGECCWHLPYY